eukprot:15345813-Ditylum_brightwellii.AAC.1
MIGTDGSWDRNPSAGGPWATSVSQGKENKNVSHVELESLNFCLFYLRIEHFSDMIASDGTRLISKVYQQGHGKKLVQQQ